MIHNLDSSQNSVISDILLLYELSLSCGHSLDPLENCKTFINALMSRMDIAYAAVWIAGSRLHVKQYKKNYELFYAMPNVRSRDQQLASHHASFVLPEQTRFKRVTAGEESFKRQIAEHGVDGGVYALFRLADFGFLKLYSHNQAAVSARELHRLAGVIDKFTITLKGAFAYQRFLYEMNEKETTRRFLEKQTALLQSLMDAVPDLIFYKDRNGRYLGCNRAFEAYTGQREAEIIGRTDFDLIDDEAATQIHEKDQEVLNTGVAHRHEEWIRYPDGRRVLQDILKSPYFDAYGDLLGLIGISRDITEHRETEQSLRRVQKMDAIGRLTGGISHDFNNILGIILGNASLLQAELSAGAEPEEKVHKRIMNITKAAQRATELTRQLLGIARHHSARSLVTNLGRLIKQMDDLIIRTMTPEVEVEYDLAPDLWLTKIDPGDFEDVLLNLILNARDAMPDGGSLQIKASNFVHDGSHCEYHPGTSPGEFVKLSVSDNGHGMTSDQQERVFEPFYSTKSNGKGTGLGLALVYGFIKRSNGHIKVYSEPGVGSTFNLYLPRNRGEEQFQAEPALVKVEMPKGTETILIVEDEEPLLSLAQDILRPLGYRLITAGNGIQALLQIERNPHIDLLFSDVVMPRGINGYALAERATAMNPKIKILLTSGFSGKPAHLDGQSSISYGMLNKPYTREQLAHKVREILGDPSPQPARRPQDKAVACSLNNPFSWSEKFGIGNAGFDSVYQDFLNLLNQIHHAALNKDRIQCKQLLSRLDEQAIHLFAREEDLMVACGYPDLDNHHQVHDMLIRQTRTLARKLEIDELKLEDLDHFISEWLADHVKIMDNLFLGFSRKSLLPQDKHAPARQWQTDLENRG